MTQISLTSVCVLPGCTQPTATSVEVCDGCRKAFGEMLHQAEGVAITPEQVAARDNEIREELRRHRAIAAMPPDRKRNQVCWMCEERRTCTRAPAGWECDECQGVS